MWTRRALRRVLLACLVAAVSPAGGDAQPVSLAMEPTELAFPSPGIPDYERGSVTLETVTIDVDARANARWTLEIVATDPDMGGYGKPVSDVLWRAGGGGAWTPLSTTREVVASGRGSGRVDLDFRVLLSWSRDRPGAYRTGLVLEARMGGGGRPGGPPRGRPGTLTGAVSSGTATTGELAEGVEARDPAAGTAVVPLPLRLGGGPPGGGR